MQDRTLQEQAGGGPMEARDARAVGAPIAPRVLGVMVAAWFVLMVLESAGALGGVAALRVRWVARVVGFKEVAVCAFAVLVWHKGMRRAPEARSTCPGDGKVVRSGLESLTIWVG